MIGLVLILGVGVALWVLKQIVGPLIGQEVKGSIPDYTADRARAAAQLLPPDLAAEYEETWLAELEALRDKPLSSLRYVRGLRRAARRIAAGSARPRVLPATLVRAIAGMGKLLNIRDRLERVSVIGLIRGISLISLTAVVVMLVVIIVFSTVPVPWVVYAAVVVPIALIVLINLGSWSGKPPSGENRGTPGGQRR